MGKRLQLEIPSDRERVLAELRSRNRSVLVVRSPLPEVMDVITEWTNDGSPMTVNVAQGKGWLKCLFASGTTLTFMVNRPGDVSRYSLVIDGVK